MIGHLQGQAISISPQRVILDVHGVGYEVQVPLSTYYEIEKAGGAVTVRLHIHTHLREDGIALYGFWEAQERELFLKLIAVSGIGPRLAQVVLSGMAARDLVAAITGGDIARLTTIPGVGKKTAERMVVELRDGLRDFAADMRPRAEAASDDLVAALINLGYKPASVERAVAQVRQEMPGAVFHELLRTSLKRLSRV
jgi:holliday junction DNA helicase RuvA